jgi:hypothetical protein
MKIEFSTDNDAFRDPNTGEEDIDRRAIECKRILKQITFMVDCHYTSGPIMDINGNKIGEWSL